MWVFSRSPRETQALPAYRRNKYPAELVQEARPVSSKHSAAFRLRPGYAGSSNRAATTGPTP